MLLNDYQKNKINALIIRFIKEKKWRMHLRKSNLGISGKIVYTKLDTKYFANVKFIERSFAYFARNYLLCYIDLEDQLEFCDFIKKYYVKPVDELFDDFLKEKNIKMLDLVNFFNETYLSHKYVSLTFDEYNRRINAIIRFKPHIMAVLDNYSDGKMKFNNINFNVLYNDWYYYYEQKAKFNF